MNLERLLDSSADELEKMTDAELLTWAKPYLAVTRPDQVEQTLVKGKRVESTTGKQTKIEKEMDPVKLEKLKRQAEQLGLDWKDLL